MSLRKNFAIILSVLLLCVKLDAVKIYLDERGPFTEAFVEVAAVDFSWQELDSLIRGAYVREGQSIETPVRFVIYFGESEELMALITSNSNAWNRSMGHFFSEDEILRPYLLEELTIKALAPASVRTRISSEQAMQIFDQMFPEQKQITPLSQAQTVLPVQTARSAEVVAIPQVRECLLCCEEKKESDFFLESVFKCEPKCDSLNICKECTLKHLDPKKTGLYDQQMETIMECPCCRQSLKENEETESLIVKAKMKYGCNFAAKERKEVLALQGEALALAILEAGGPIVHEGRRHGRMERLAPVPVQPSRSLSDLFEALRSDPRNLDIYREIVDRLTDVSRRLGLDAMKESLNNLFELYILNRSDWEYFINWFEALPQAELYVGIIRHIEEVIRQSSNIPMLIEDCKYLLEAYGYGRRTDKKLFLEQCLFNLKIVKKLALMPPELYEIFVVAFKAKVNNNQNSIETLSEILSFDIHDYNFYLLNLKEKESLNNLANALYRLR